MATTKQIAANRRNALKSTGPKTPKGKAIVALNATKHGLLSREVLLPEEDEAALVQLGQRLRAQLQPIGELEILLVDRIVSSAWRLRRALAVEVGVTQDRRFDYRRKDEGTGGAFVRASDTYVKLSRYEATIERGLYRALHELQRLQAARAGEDVPVPAVLDVDFTAEDAGA